LTKQSDYIDCLELWTKVAPYCDFPCQTISWRLAPAIESGQYMVYYQENGLVSGFVTWAWMTDEEFETRKYCGLEVFERETGDKLVFLDMIAPDGTSGVLRFCRELRKFFRIKFPEIEKVWSHRGPRSGVYPNKGG